ncbi:MAG: class I SAM-dependent methyltransferase [Phycisphaerae bacterium]|nr:class I SAM-dependent methyltransferase [Phycisphaerae bacterium]
MTKEWFKELDDELWLQGDERADEQAAFIKKVLRLRKGQTVLDAPCGDGRIAVGLARLGLLVVGVDHDPYFIARARARFEEEGLEGEFLVGDIREVAFVGCFHAAINWGGSFGYFSDEENFETLQRLARAVRKGGRVLVDQPNREHILRHFRRRQERGRVEIKNRWDARRERVVGRWTLRRHGSIHRFKTSIRLYTPREMRALFRKAGLKAGAAYGTPEGRRFRRTSPRLILVGTRTRSSEL